MPSLSRSSYFHLLSQGFQTTRWVKLLISKLRTEFNPETYMVEEENKFIFVVL